MIASSGLVLSAHDGRIDTGAGGQEVVEDNL